MKSRVAVKIYQLSVFKIHGIQLLVTLVFKTSGRELKRSKT